ncbi:MAG: hypothetical protein P4L51_26095 [Puia sp.]|nr:hypothetical protein [Puia sp.]
MKSTNSKRAIIVGLSMLALVVGTSTADAQVSLGISISARIAPPALPVYTQPPCPVDGYLWTPGYWAYDDIDGYYWVPGVWVSPPVVGYLWTPCYWGYAGGVYGWHPGYWGPHVGFYGGVNYGYGYGGSGFVGGGWYGGHYRYNTAVVNVNTTVVRNTYIDRTVVNNTTVVNNHTSFNGGPGGIAARPTPQEQVAMNERHVQATAMQTSHQQTASHDRTQFASVNHGSPATAAMNRVGGSRFNPQGHPAATNAAAHPSGLSRSSGTPGTARNTRLSSPSHSPAPAHMVQQRNNNTVQHNQPQHSQPQHNQPQHNQPQHIAPQHNMPPQQHVAMQHANLQHPGGGAPHERPR